MALKKPKMIMFDYGQTLGNEPGYDVEAGMTALLSKVTANPNNVTAAELAQKWMELFGEVANLTPQGRGDALVEIHNVSMMRYLLEYFGIEHGIKSIELDELFWDNAANGIPTKGIEKLLRYLHENGYRTAVISNLMYSGEALDRRINRILSAHWFEFMYATSDYMFRKPSKRIFELAIRRSGLSPEDIWYCGDSALNDCEGAHAMGIFPVWYTGAHRREESGPKCDCLRVPDWDEMIEVLEGLK